MEPIIQLRNLKKNYGSKEAVRGLDLDISAGELFVLVGPNGAGKTTTLKMLAGLLRPTEGSVRVAGWDILENPLEAKRVVSFVPDIPYIYEKLTAREILRFVGKLYDMEASAIEERSKELLEFFNLWEARDTLTEELSHGMRQKVILSASLLHKPSVFILDEPMVGLDPISIKDFKVFMRRKVKEGMTIVFSTHTLATAEELADRIAIIDHGLLIALGTLEELRTRYESKENLENMFIKLVEHEPRV